MPHLQSHLDDLGEAAVLCPCRRGQQRLQGKDDLLDAEDAARQVLAGQAAAVPKLSEGSVEMIRILKAA